LGEEASFRPAITKLTLRTWKHVSGVGFRVSNFDLGKGFGFRISGLEFWEQSLGCSGSEAGSYLRLIDFVYHSTLGLRVIKKKEVDRG